MFWFQCRGQWKSSLQTFVDRWNGCHGCFSWSVILAVTVLLLIKTPNAHSSSLHLGVYEVPANLDLGGLGEGVKKYSSTLRANETRAWGVTWLFADFNFLPCTLCRRLLRKKLNFRATFTFSLPGKRAGGKTGGSKIPWWKTRQREKREIYSNPAELVHQ